MENWIFFILIAEFIWTICVIIDKFVISKSHIENPLVYIILNGLMNIFLIFVLPFTGFKLISLNLLFFVILKSIAMHTGVAIFYKAIQHEEVSKLMIMNQMTPIFVLFFSFIFLNEILTTNHLIGFLLLIAAGLLVSYRKTKVTSRISKALYLILISTFFVGIAYTATKHVYSNVDFWTAFVWLRIGAFTALLVLLSKRIRKDFKKTYVKMPIKVRSLMFFKMLIDFSAFIFMGIAVTNGPVSLVAAIGAAIQPIMVFFAIVLITMYIPKVLKEKIDKKSIMIKFVALIVAVIGIVFVNL